MKIVENTNHSIRFGDAKSGDVIKIGNWYYIKTECVRSLTSEAKWSAVELSSGTHTFIGDDGIVEFIGQNFVVDR